MIIVCRPLFDSKLDYYHSIKTMIVISMLAGNLLFSYPFLYILCKTGTGDLAMSLGHFLNKHPKKR